MRVLYVEDDGTVAKSVQLMLESEGHDCDATDSGKRAIELAKRGRYDIILLDIMLPDIDGYEVIKRLRAAGVRTPFLIQTGLVGDGYQQEGLSLGVSQYLVKPFNKKELIERIEGVVSSARHKPAVDPAVEQALEDSAREHADERRRHRRFETALPAKILHNDGIDCVILNMSYGGAAIQLPGANTVCPPVFDLQVAFGSKFRCKVCWRFQDKIGVKGEAGWSEQIMAARSRAAAPAAASADAAPPTAADREDLPLSYAPRAPAAEPRAQAPASTGRDQDTPLPDILGLAEEPAAATDRVAKPVPAAVVDHAAEPVPAPQAEQVAQPGPAVVEEPIFEPEPAAQVEQIAEPEPAAQVEQIAEPETAAKAEEIAEPVPAVAEEQIAEPEPAAMEERTAEPTAAPQQDEQPEQQAFVVDAGVRLVAETLECGELLVKGRLEASVRAERLWVAPGGQVVGSAEVGTADVAGRFEGTLNVAGRLVIDAAGCVSGRAQYREILIEPGGEISGEFQKLSANGAAEPANPAKQQPVAGPVAATGR